MSVYQLHTMRSSFVTPLVVSAFYSNFAFASTTSTAWKYTTLTISRAHAATTIVVADADQKFTLALPSESANTPTTIIASERPFVINGSELIVPARSLNAEDVLVDALPSGTTYETVPLPTFSILMNTDVVSSPTSYKTSSATIATHTTSSHSQAPASKASTHSSSTSSAAPAPPPPKVTPPAPVCTGNFYEEVVKWADGYGTRSSALITNGQNTLLDPVDAHHVQTGNGPFGKPITWAPNTPYNVTITYEGDFNADPATGAYKSAGISLQVGGTTWNSKDDKEGVPRVGIAGDGGWTGATDPGKLTNVPQFNVSS